MKLRLLTLLFCSSLMAAAQARPPITGISHISVYAGNAAAAQHFYVDDLGCVKGADPENSAGTRYYVDPTQFIEVLPLPAGNSPDRLDHMAYKTSDAVKLREYLKAKGVSVPASVEKGSDGSRWFFVKDPEGNKVEFTQPPAHPAAINGAKLAGHHIIHVGMLVHSKDKEDAFYRKILGFKPYWYGGMKPGELDWVSQQTPNGHDWLEYMLTHGSAEMSQRQLGVMNHFSIGVVNMQKAYQMLKGANRLVPADSHPQLGKDGKWQLNVFDPDGTRVEYMEYSNVRPPCCSKFTAPNPTPVK